MQIDLLKNPEKNGGGPGRKKQSFKGSRDINLQSLENSIRDKIGLNVSIKNKKNNTGSLVLEYKDLDQLNKIIEILKSNY